MSAILVAVFVLAYAAIALEHPLKVNKSASALVGAGLLWTIHALWTADPARVSAQLSESLAATAQIVFFLIGAMTIVEVVDAHNGFDVVTQQIRTTRLPALMWLIGIVTFLLSAVLDNLTTTIVMVSLLKKLLARREDRLPMVGIVVIAANSGGAWSPIGDVTTTMLWIGGQITGPAIIAAVLLPALVSLLVPLSISAARARGQRVGAPPTQEDRLGAAPPLDTERNIMFFLGIGILCAVPAFKSLTHLPPFLGILFGLGLLWLVGDLLHRNKPDDDKHHLTLVHALGRIDMGSIVFFIGILLAVATLEHTHILAALANWLQRAIGRIDVIVLLTGMASAVVDNVPLVAAAMGMYPLETYPQDHMLWAFLAYCAGTGGSILIIGSAAGVAAMGLEKVEFFWYARRIGWLALIGYLAGAGVYLLQLPLDR